MRNLLPAIVVFCLTACTSGSSSAVLPEIEMPAASATGTATQASTMVEPTRQSTAMVEAVQFDFDLPEATIENITEIPAVVRDQTFPLETTTRPDGSISRPFRCVSDGLYVGRIQLTENIFSLVSAECWYEVDGERKVIYVPLMFSDGDKRTIVRFEMGEYDPRMEEFSDEAFWVSLLSKVGYTGDGHIFVVNADSFDSSLGAIGTFDGFGADELAEKFNTQYEEFGQSGDPNVTGGVLPSWNIGFAEGLND